MLNNVGLFNMKSVRIKDQTWENSWNPAKNNLASYFFTLTKSNFWECNLQMNLKTLSLLYWFSHFFCKVMLVKEFSFLSSFCFSASLVRKTSYYTVASVNKPSFKERSWFFNGFLKRMGRHFANYLNQQ